MESLANLMTALILANLSFSILTIVLNFIAKRTENKHDDAVARVTNKIAKRFVVALDLLSGNIKHK